MMIRLALQPARTPARSHSTHRAATRLGLLSAVLAASLLASCGKKEEKKVAPPPPPPPPVAAQVDVDALIQTMRPDARVQFPASKAPRNEALARAVISLADAFAKGDSDELARFITPDTKADLSALTSSGEWDDALKKIEAVRVVRLEATGDEGAPASAILSLALQDDRGAYVLNWIGVRTGDEYLFEGMRSSADVRRRADEWDTGGWDYTPPVAGDGPTPGPEPAAAQPGGQTGGQTGAQPGTPDMTK